MRTLRKKSISLMLIFTILMAVFMPTVVNAEESSRVQIIMSESANNNYGTYDVSGGSFEITMNLNGPRAEFVDIGTQIILSVTPDQYHTFKGWYLAEEYEIVAGLMGWRPINENSPLSTNATYQFTVTESYYNIMPVFESKVGHNNIWMTGNGEIAVLYENRDTNEQQELDGEHWMSNGIVVDYIKGDEITLYARPTTGNYFVGWFITDRAASDPANYVREPVISTNTTFTYKPGITTIDVGGVEEPLNYVTAVFAPNSSKPKRTVVTEFIARPYDTEEVPYDTDLATYTSSKKWNVTTEGTDTNNSWLELFGEVDGVWQYPAERGVTYTFVEQEITDTEILNKYTITYDQVIVTKASTPTAENTHSVTFDLNYDGAEPFMTIPNVTNGSKVNAPDPNPGRNGYTFEGWFKDTTGVIPFDFESDTIEANTIIYAKWTENQQITFQLDGATVSENVITFQAGETTITATVTGTGYEFDGNNLKVNESDLNNVKLVLSNNFDNSKMKLKLHNQQELVVTGDGEAIFDGLDFSQDSSPHLGLYVENNGGEHHGGDNTQNYQGNATSTLNYKITGAIEYTSGGGFDHGISFRINDIPYKADESKMQYTEGTAYERDEKGQIILDENNNPIVVKDPETMQTMTEKTGLNINGDTIHYDYDTNTNKVKFTFTMAPGTLMTGLKINGQTINNLPNTKAELEACYTDHRLEIEVDNIDKADLYNIEIEARYPNDNEQFMGNFLWDYNPQGYTGSEDKILNATLTLVEAEYNGHKYTTEDEINALGGVYIWNDADRKKTYTDDREGVGEAQFPVGTKLTVKIIPDAGYQLVNFGINGGVFDSQEEIGTYTFEVKGGPFHLQANIAQVDDVVKTKSEKIESGSITLGGTESSMAVGTARLDVDDVTLSQTQISNFEEAAEGYDIKNYIDISLFNTVFKGKETASWDTEVKDLENDATIKLKLEDGINGDEVVIVHEKHDGTYEIIPVEYDEYTNTITFKTKSFSNYAIATKTASTQEDNTNTENGTTNTNTDNTTSTNESSTTSSSPKTGDNITMWISLMLVSILGVFGTFKYLRKRV